MNHFEQRTTASEQANNQQRSKRKSVPAQLPANKHEREAADREIL